MLARAVIGRGDLVAILKGRLAVADALAEVPAVDRHRDEAPLRQHREQIDIHVFALLRAMGHDHHRPALVSRQLVDKPGTRVPSCVA